MGTYAIEVTELNFDVISDLRGKKNAILTTNLVVIFVFFEMIATKKFPTVTVIYVGNDDKSLILHLVIYRAAQHLDSYILLQSIWGVPLACLGSS